MKKYVSIIAMMLCAFILSVNPAKAGNKGMTCNGTECACCKNCKDDKCKELCKKWSGMTAEAQKSEEGKKVKEECKALCEKNKCCTSADGKKSSCEGMEGKGCCKKK